MSKVPIRRALISVHDKTGVVEFARALVEEFGVEIISTGGTARVLREAGVPVTLVEQITGFSEMLDGRVKTLHPRIHAAILADRDNPEHMRQLREQGIEPIDLVVVSLYPFERTVADPRCRYEQAVEMIDIGGPCLLRAAAKNHQHVLAVCRADEAVYEKVLHYMRSYDRSVPGDDLHARYAKWAFEATAEYDARIHEWLQQHDVEPELVRLVLREGDELRYGENPHQSGKLTSWAHTEGEEASLISPFPDYNEKLGGLSYNNYLDAHAALGLCAEITRSAPALCGTEGEGHRLETGATPEGEADRLETGAAGLNCCVFIKHNNPCGVGVAATPLEAYQSAYLGDPSAAMGGVLACNFAVDAEFAGAVMDTYARWGQQAGAGGFFVEVWIAPRFSEEAVSAIRSRKSWGQRVRLLPVDGMGEPADADQLEYRSLAGGLLVQTRDLVGLNEDQWRVVTKRAPSDTERAELRLAWLSCKHTRSNAISICRGGMLIGNGAGQMSRVMSCRIATWLARENGHGDALRGAVAASDAFFPFRDGPELLLEAGVTSLIQPGGSKRDTEAIAACDERGAAMIFTGTRHFRH
jgi:phosphoribosylaminoimidazolecarboxamide formyltransferase/IMP cyclohydrolase